MDKKSLAVELFIVAVIVAVIGFAIHGSASDKTGMSFMGQVDISGEHEASVHFELDTNDPSLVNEVHLEIITLGSALSVTAVVISLDNGASWTECREDLYDHWTCEFENGEEPEARNISTLKVVIN
jgi:hypothetical protein